MGHYTPASDRDHAEQAGGLLAVAIEMGYGTKDVHCDPASAGYEAPDDVVEAYVQHLKDTADDGPADEENPLPKRRGRKPAAEAEAGKE